MNICEKLICHSCEEGKCENTEQWYACANFDRYCDSEEINVKNIAFNTYCSNCKEKLVFNIR